MKNVHVLPTPNPSYLYKMSDGSLNISDLFEGGNSAWKNQNIYITSDEEIIGGKEWFLDLTDNSLFKNQVDEPMSKVLFPNCKKIILTTDRDLIKDGVQAIDDNFLEWFVENPSCEEVEIVYDYFQINQDNPVTRGSTALVQQYKIIIPKEEHKQETLKEAAERYENKDQHKRSKLDFIEGAKWQHARMYSEEDLREAYFSAIKSTGEGWNGEYTGGNNPNIEEVFGVEFETWKEQFKKKQV